MNVTKLPILWTLALLIIGAAGATRAATRSWDDGGPDNLWQTAANWTGDTLPVAGDDVRIGDWAAAAGDEVALAGGVTIVSLTMLNETKLSTGQYQLLVQGGELQLLSTLGGSWLAAEDRDPGQPARTTLLDSVDADALRVDNDCLLSLDDGVVEVDVGELYLAPLAFLVGTGRIDLARTDGGLNFNNNGAVTSSVANGELLIQNDAQIPGGANGTIDLDGTTGYGRWVAMRGDITITAPLSDHEYGGLMSILDGNQITIADFWQLGGEGAIQFENGGTVTGGDLEIYGTTTVSATDGGTARFSNMRVEITGGTPEFSVAAGSILDFGDNGSVTYAAASARYHGDGTLRPASTNIVNAPTKIGDEGTNELQLDMDAGSWELNANLRLSVATIDPAGDGFDDTVRINDALLNLDLPGDFLLQGALIFNGGTVDNVLSPGTELLLNETATIRAESGLARIQMPVRFLDDTSTAYVASGATLEIDATTFRGGHLYGGGVLRAGVARVEAPTTIEVATLDMDDGHWTVNDVLTLVVDGVEVTAGDGFDGTIAVNSAALDLNVASGEFNLQGDFDLTSAAIDSTLHATTITLSEAADITALAGVSQINTPVEFLDGTSRIDVDISAELILAEGATFRGGTIHGGGILRVAGDAYVAAPTTIAVGTLDFDDAEWHVNADLTLDASAIDHPSNKYNGHVLVHNAMLTVNTPWEAGAGANVELSGGELAGFGLVLDDVDAYLTGFGTVTAAVVNDGLIRADGGTLWLGNAGSDWDGAANAGRLNAYSGDLHLVNALPFVFHGVAAAFAGHELFIDGSAFHFDTGSLLWLADGSFRSGATFNDLDGQLLVGAGPSSTIDANLFRIDSHAQVALGANLLLAGGATEILSGAAFSGGGALIVDKGSRLTLLDGANVQVALENHGSLAVGASLGQVQGHDYRQGASGQMEIELGGASLNDYDRLTLGGAARLAGQLTVSLWAGFNPTIGQTFSVLSAAGGRVDAFDHVLLPPMDPGELMLVTYGDYDVTLRVVHLFEADFDEDGNVDGDDLDRWQAGFGVGALHTQGDADGNGSVNGADYLVWQRQFGSSALLTLANTVVPEPATWVTLLIGLAAYMRASGLRRFEFFPDALRHANPRDPN